MLLLRCRRSIVVTVVLSCIIACICGVAVVVVAAVGRAARHEAVGRVRVAGVDGGRVAQGLGRRARRAGGGVGEGT